jgi:hypothetical protein
MNTQMRRELEIAEIDTKLETLVMLSGQMHGQAVQIGNELRSQLAMIHELDGHMDRTQARLDGLNGQVRKLETESGVLERIGLFFQRLF